MTAEELDIHYPWKVDQLVYVKKADGTIVAESIYKNEDAEIPQPIKHNVSDTLEQHIMVSMKKEIDNEVKFIPATNALFIVGPSGSGKSSFARVIADKLGQSCSFYDSKFLTGKWRNSASVNLQKIFNSIDQKNQPQTIVLDNLEYIIKRHNDGGDNGVLVLCSYLDQFWREKYPITVIGITNNNIDIPSRMFYKFCHSK
jgi:AAA+ superfamily predicted ATPase